MNILDGIRKLGGYIRNQISGVTNPAHWLVRYVQGDRQSDTGIRINGTTIYQYAPYYNCVLRVAGQVGAIELQLKQRIGDDVRTVQPYEHPAVNLLNLSPNNVQTSQDFRETGQGQAITWGNARIAVLRDSSTFGRPRELLLMEPSRTTTYKLVYPDKSWDLVHKYTTDDGEPVDVFDKDCLHIKNLSGDGLVGFSLIELANNAIGGGLAGEKLTNRGYANDSTPGVILEVPIGQLKRQADVDQFREEFVERHGGLTNPSKVALLRHGITAKTLTMSGRDAQIVEARRLSREDAALFVNCSDLLGIDDSTSYNSVEQKAAAEYRRCYYRWFRKWEQQCDRKLLTEAERRAGYFFQHNVATLLRGSFREQLETLARGREAGLIGQREARRELGLGPPDPTDDYSNPNTSSSGTAGTAGAPAERNGGDLAENLARFLRSELAGLERIAAKQPNQFCNLLDAFYAERACQLTDLVRAHGGDWKHAASWIKESKAELLYLAGQVQPGQLIPALRVVGERWTHQRAPAIARKIERRN